MAAADGTRIGACYGLLTPAEAERIVDALRHGGSPSLPAVPWLAVARGPRGLAALASPMLPSGLFWSAQEGVLTVATDPRAACSADPVVDSTYVRAFAAGRPAPEAAPFAGVTREVAGAVVTWPTPTDAPRRYDLEGVPGLPDPADEFHRALSGDAAVAALLAALDDACADLSRRIPGTPVLALSAGLDSTAVATSLLRCGPVHGLTYRPRVGARLSLADGAWADEGPPLADLEAMHPSTLTIEPVVNENGVRPLEAAAAAAARGGVPVFAPANQIWLDAMRDHVGPGSWLVTGGNGNAAFSFEHGYARTRSGVRALRARWRARGAPAPAGALAAFGVGADLSPLIRTRADYLHWLARRLTGLPAGSNPAAVAGVLFADPFSAPGVLAVAARITPAEWRHGGPRGLARRALRGRVPDAVRLRHGRGQQGRDAWSVIRDDRDDYLDRIAALGNVAGLEDVRVSGLHRHVAAWPWRTDDPPPWREQVALDRLLALADFAGAAWSPVREARMEP